jgi:hypothetical protein
VAEIESFTTWHREHCGQEPQWEALHVDIDSDLLLLGPFETSGDAVNVLEAVRIGAQQVLEVGQQELEVLVLTEEDGREVGVMFDPFPGGSGLLPLVQEHWEAVADAARRAMARCDCERACYSCLLDFRNQQFHTILDRFRAIEALAACSGPFIRENDVSPNWASATPDTGQQDSGSEEDLLTIRTRRGFPQPVAQYRLVLGGGDVTIADFAYPEKKVLIFVDGLSEGIHGNPQQQARDRLKRRKAQMAGWQVLPISAQGLGDHEMLRVFLDELSMVLNGRE